MRAVAALLTVLAVNLTNARAQQPAQMDPAPFREGMRMFERMAGRWEGDAWMLMPTGRQNSRMVETVEARLGGTIYVIEGRGTDPARPDQVQHHAFAVVTFDPAARTYSMRSHLDNGMVGEFALTPTSDGWFWERPAGPRARVRYQVRITADQWIETGEYLAEGSAPRQIMEMRLTRVR